MTRPAMTDTDRRDIINHVMHFGASAVVHKKGRDWWIDFRGFGFPSPFQTKRAAMARVSDWVCAMERVRREARA